MTTKTETAKAEPVTAVVRPEVSSVVAYGPTGVQIKTLDDAWRLARYIVASGFAPKGMDKPEAVLIACQMGAELGLSPMASLQNIAVINGRPNIYGDAALALVRGSGKLEAYQQSWQGSGDTRKAVVTLKRVNDAPQTHEFSVADAKRAGLWGKAGPWSQYPDRMLMFRARGFALRDAFGDVLKGLITAEEARDFGPSIAMTEDADGAFVAPRPLKRAPVVAEPVVDPASVAGDEPIEGELVPEGDDEGRPFG